LLHTLSANCIKALKLMKYKAVVYCAVGKEDNIDVNVIGLDSDVELTSSALSTAAMSAAAAAAAHDDDGDDDGDDGDDCDDGWQTCDVETAYIPPELYHPWHNYVR